MGFGGASLKIDRRCQDVNPAWFSQSKQLIDNTEAVNNNPCERRTAFVRIPTNVYLRWCNMAAPKPNTDELGRSSEIYSWTTTCGTRGS